MPLPSFQKEIQQSATKSCHLLPRCWSCWWGLGWDFDDNGNIIDDTSLVHYEDKWLVLLHPITWWHSAQTAWLYLTAPKSSLITAWYYAQWQGTANSALSFSQDIVQWGWGDQTGLAHHTLILFFFYWAYLCQTLHMLNCMIGWSSLCCMGRVHNPHSYVTACKSTHTIIAWVPFDYSILNVAEVVVVGLFLFWGSGIAGVVGGLVRLSRLADGNLGLSLWLVLGWGYKLWRWFD